ncbi:alpha/beta hydrolase family protein [Saccharothrix algeriensis]|uniref:Alpha/beta hydrolase n=1 Tax=Saccharothrix algeriensis TaxID=173560 RepID=A0A8T8HTV4_9PSEU|nr:alpha/beta family hydrolase [Saccharothrix algeriensis]MBM7812996.1 putative alpha/beta-hydrolase family hydrolase [Saccharothrix algeriensis]QTR01620.1 alpha/beta hydrolase [Saccharothrix algeriensis]
MTSTTVDTPHGPARAELHCAPEGRAALLLGHGAGGGICAPDLVAAARAAVDAGVHVALVEQPYRVAGRRAPAPAKQLDAAWLAVVEDLSTRWFDEVPLIFGGRSSGARVACRTSAEGQAVAVLCLAFPVHPPGKPDKSRLPELDAVDPPVLVVQGDRDPFGRPEPAHHREVVLLPGDHNLKADLEGVRRTVGEWLDRILRPLD